MFSYTGKQSIIFTRNFPAAFLSVILVCAVLNAEAPDPVRGRHGMVVSSDKLASEVGAAILKKGGNAVDAAVGVGFALAVTFPYAGNIGGGGFMVIHLKDGRNTAIDFREKAPESAYRDMFLDKDGNYLPELSVSGTTSTGVPGSVAGLIYALEKYGTMSLAEVIQPAIDLAEKGFILDYQTVQSFNFSFTDFQKYPSSFRIFTKNGNGFAEGDTFKQPDLAFTLKQIKEKGRDGFYKGKIAGLIVRQVKEFNGMISLKDLEDYKPVEREPVTGTYRGYSVISMPPPSSGGIALIQLLNILENFNFEKNDWGSSAYIFKLTEAMKHVYADRSVHLGDPDFYDVPRQWLISKEYGRQIFSKIDGTAVSSKEILPGSPVRLHESSETTHYSVYDSCGNAVSTTTTLNSAFGNKIVVEGAGFLLNNEMDDFSAKPGVPNQFGLLGNEANAVQPGKRMLSSMAPTIILKDDKPFLIVGSPGGSTIITAVLQVIMNVIDFGMDIQEAISAPRMHHQWYPDKIDYENFGLSYDVRQALISRGETIGDIRTLGCVEGILIDSENNIIYGASDPRGNGGACGY
ncbi:MAG TPA: gamma-glutamyltransferase [Ignavibacteriaceae bacterium]|nr:gamma-glutamyltransferase [Ignavibacteriaceae bacterium]